MYCKNCGNSIDDNAVVCPHCGVQVGTVKTQDYGYQNKDTSNPIAIVGFVLSFFFAIAGLICSIIGYKRAKDEGLDNKSLALAGIIISAIEITIIVLYIIILIAGISCIAASAPNFY